MKTERRGLKSAIAASLDAQVSLPWQRGARRKPQAVKPVAVQAARTGAIAAR